jgi:hypothetical protein
MFFLLLPFLFFKSMHHFQGAMSVDSITDLDDNQSRLLEALQLSLPAEAQSKKEKARDKKLSLNPIYRQVPRLVDSCCQHLEKHGKTCHQPSVIQASFLYSILCSFEQVLDKPLINKVYQCKCWFKKLLGSTRLGGVMLFEILQP